MAQTRLHLRRGDLRLDLAPAAGGAVAGFWRDGPGGALALLRPLPDGQEDALHAGMFPMAPFANCIRDNRFAFAGQDWQVAPNMRDTRLNFHGSAWRLPWQVALQGPDSAALALAADDGIWRYDARQTFALNGDGLDVALSVTNRGAAAMPFGFGLHPWFPRHGQAIVRFGAGGLWQLDPEGEALALGPVPVDHSHANAAKVPHRPLNLCYDGWAGTAQIDWPDMRLGVTLRADPVMGKLMVHVPAHDLDTFCLEPQSNAPCGFDALARGQTAPGVHILAPGETLAGRMSLHLSPITTEPSLP